MAMGDLPANPSSSSLSDQREPHAFPQANLFFVVWRINLRQPPLLCHSSVFLLTRPQSIFAATRILHSARVSQLCGYPATPLLPGHVHVPERIVGTFLAYTFCYLFLHFSLARFISLVFVSSANSVKMTFLLGDSRVRVT